ncbi:DUF885 domain-containing protein [Chitinophaga pendula]|uniref:DUF885 domain-containing protein n=1 Tax=Chitinophaga TaxID=79328 RepID=UPI000BAFFEA8|nr:MULTISPECIES: DUF885 domain-containing protein [Chitinophaga]ASZ15110.1 DUF885 domain-containing protein [Chitinophaga sp. MD30]UCJ08339.1 DUF885 domain-containing protein [Chitinophaga pendula]
MKQYLAYACILGSLAACNSHTAESTGSTTDTTHNPAFSQYEAHFIEEMWKLDPGGASEAGYHKYDSVLLVNNDAYRSAQLQFVKTQLDSLSHYDTTKLSGAYQIDYYLIRNYLQKKRFGIEELQQYVWDPADYNVSDNFARMLSENYAPLETRLRNFAIRLKQVPAYYEAARQQIANPVKELTELGISQNLGGLSVFEKDFADSLNHTSIPADEKATMIAQAKTAAQAIRGYADWLKALKNDHPRDFRLGSALYEKKFGYNIVSAYTAAQIYDSAVARKNYLHGEMAKLAQQLWPKYFGTAPAPAEPLALIKRMIDTLSVQHVKAAEFQQAIEKQIPTLVAFIKEKDLLYLDPSKPLVVRREPEYMAGVAGASISAPGPYDKGGNTYYNVGSLQGWPTEKAESYLREYNHYILQILNIHEAIPGHYTQLVYANQSPSLIKSLLGNGAMIEGWAVYTEQMMLENGYGNNEPEMWLMWYKWNLRTVCNTILDYSVHVKNMSREDAIRLLTMEAFQQQAEAEGKWRRVSVTSVQLTSYYTGYKEIIDLRTAYKQKMGDKYQLKTFNEKFLSYGSAPVKYIGRLMLR